MYVYTYVQIYIYIYIHVNSGPLSQNQGSRGDSVGYVGALGHLISAPQEGNPSCLLSTQRSLGKIMRTRIPSGQMQKQTWDVSNAWASTSCSCGQEHQLLGVKTCWVKPEGRSQKAKKHTTAVSNEARTSPASPIGSTQMAVQLQIIRAA